MRSGSPISGRSVLLLLLLHFCIVLADERGTYLNRNAASWAADLAHADARQRRAAAFALGRLGTAAVPHLPALTPLLSQDKDPVVRAAVAAALAELGTLAASKVVPPLVHALEKDPDVTVRRAAAQALGRLGDRAGAAHPALTKALQAEDVGLRQAAAQALGQLGQAAAPAAPALTTLLTDHDAGVRRQVVTALGNLGADAAESISAMSVCLTDKELPVREAAVLALRQLGPLAFPTAEALLTLAESPAQPAALRQAALVTLEQVWPTGPKADALWGRLLRLAEHEAVSGIKNQAQETQRKVAPRRRD